MNDFVDFRSLISLVIRRWWLIAIFLVIAGATAAFINSRQTPIFQATTSLLVGRPVRSTEIDRFDIQISQQSAQTYADLALRQPVLQNTIDELGLEMQWVELRNRVHTELGNNAQLLEIKVESASTTEAERIADEIARQLISLSPSGSESPQKAEAEQFANSRIQELRGKIESGQARLTELQNVLLEGGPSFSVSDLQTQITTLEGLIARWEENYLQFLAHLDNEDRANNLAVLEMAQVGANPIRPNTQLNLFVALIIGFALALGLIFLLEFLDNTLRNSEDVERILGLPTLGAINKIKSNNMRDTLIVNHDPFSPAYEDYRLLRTKIQFLAVDHPGRVIMVTSPNRSEGKSITAANLGIVMAQVGLKTVIVDANLRQPMMHDLFRLNNQEGLTHFLQGTENAVDTHLQSTVVPNLKILVSGALPSNPSELLGSERMDSLLALLGESSDVILCDMTEAVTVADASALSNKTDGVILVIEPGKTRRDSAMQAVANLQDARSTVVGCVLNRTSQKNRVAVFSRESRSGKQYDEERLSYAEPVGNR